ncbi:Armadillo repeat-containing kinesin-like protein 1 [Apostasia shenzhenica]|uniref:Kinesin-like protein n=1 Tax=Apostasia shenzhenica TaxID=1088818 RepID=A0A2I0B4M8_9ASPA|nr:Armadillo repeat-containing kinesin-like protein 1 [Apostasia shenzhenica]
MASHSQSRASLRSERYLTSAKPVGIVGVVVNRSSFRVKKVGRKRATTSGLRAIIDDGVADSGRVRVAVRLCPKNSEDLSHGSDFVDCIELQPELKMLKIRRNNWISESYRFDEIFAESSSQRHVYETAAKPVVESVLSGYNGTVMAYGQTGTGKTHTIGWLGKDDPSERGVMVRAMEDIFANTSTLNDTVSITYLQLYLETIQDLLEPEKNDLFISEDPKSGEILVRGAAIVEVRDIENFLELLQVGEANRHAANTKFNTESSRSHAILMVHVQRTSRGQEENRSSLVIRSSISSSSSSIPIVLKSKLLIVDLAGSERIDKSGSEGHMLEEAKFINLSLTSLGKCINALAENSLHIPTRDSKLTRLLQDSLGGTAKTSLIITIGASARHFSETSSTILFGQRAMKVVNTVKLKEEYDYEKLCRKLEKQIDHLTSEMERQQKLRKSDKENMERRLKQCEACLAETEKILVVKEKHHLENFGFQSLLADTTRMYEEKVAELVEQLQIEHSQRATLEDHLTSVQQQLSDNISSLKKQQKAMDELHLNLNEMSKKNEEAASVILLMKAGKDELLSEKELLCQDLKASQEKLLHEEMHRKSLEDEIIRLNQVLTKNTEVPKGIGNTIGPSGLEYTVNSSKHGKPRENIPGQRATIAKIFEEVGISNILNLLKSDDLDIQTHAVKVVANLAAEDVNQQRIVEEGGLDALLFLLDSSEDATIQRLSAGALANLAMNGMNQDLIISKGGARLLARMASRSDDPQALRMVAGAIANLCGNDRLHMLLKEDGGIKALLSMVRCMHSNVIAQVARGMANFAKCESRSINQGYWKGRSLLIEDDALNWMVANCTTFSDSTRHHIELALCHLAQNEDNALDVIKSGGVKELLRISQESSREDICKLAKKVLKSNPVFSAELERLKLNY